MKIVNEKGKLFGLVNLVDLVVVLMILLLAVGVYSRTGIAERLQNQGQQEAQMVEGQLKLLIPEVRDFVLDGFSEGDTLRDSSTGSLIGKIVGIEVEPYYDTAPDSAGNLVKTPDPIRNDIILTVVTQGVVSPEGEFLLDSKAMLIGEVMIIQSYKNKARVVIIDVKY